MLNLEVLAKGTELLVPAACGPSPVLFIWLTEGLELTSWSRRMQVCAHRHWETLHTRIFGRFAEHSRHTISKGKYSTVSHYLRVKSVGTGHGSSQSKHVVSANPDLFLTDTKKSILEFLAKRNLIPFVYIYMVPPQGSTSNVDYQLISV